MQREWKLVWHFLQHRWTRYVAAWLAASALALHVQHLARHSFDEGEGHATDKRRADRNAGHTSIDFGGQWLMGRMLVLGHAQELYNRNRHYEVLQAAYPRSDQAPAPAKHDADDLFAAMMDADEALSNRTIATRQTFGAVLMGADAFQALTVTAVCQDRFWSDTALNEVRRRHVGGPLYPPIHAFLMAPLAQDNDPRRSYFTMQWLVLAAGVFAALGVSVATHGRIWWPVAIILILLFPGFKGGHDLAQNPAVTLAIVVWGWALVARERPLAGGLIWAMLAFKPTWMIAFFLVPLLSGRWRACLSMVLGATALGLASLPVVGIHGWLDWLKVGKVANFTYDVDANWIPLSRDLFGIPRRLLIDTSDHLPYAVRDRWYAHVAGWAIWLVVLEVSVKVSRLAGPVLRRPTGVGPAFLFLAGWMLCLHFMYYDALLAALGVMLLFDPADGLFKPMVVRANAPGTAAMDYFNPAPVETHPGFSGRTARGAFVVNSFRMYFFAALLAVQHTLPWADAAMSISMGKWFPERSVSSRGAPVMKDGKPAMSSPRLVVDPGSKGTPAETILILGLWGWCAIRLMCRPRDSRVIPEEESTLPRAVHASAERESDRRPRSL